MKASFTDRKVKSQGNNNGRQKFKIEDDCLFSQHHKAHQHVSLFTVAITSTTEFLVIFS